MYTYICIIHIYLCIYIYTYIRGYQYGTQKDYKEGDLGGAG